MGHLETKSPIIGLQNDWFNQTTHEMAWLNRKKKNLLDTANRSRNNTFTKRYITATSSPRETFWQRTIVPLKWPTCNMDNTLDSIID